MASEFRLDGVPRALAMDAWWLGDPSPAPERPGIGARLAPRREALVLLALVAIGDFLFYGHAPGLSLALFAVAVFLAVGLTHPFRLRPGPAILLVLSVLPMVEYLQALSLAFLVVGLTASLLWMRGGTGGLWSRCLALWATLPWRGAADGWRHAAKVANSDALRGQWRSARGWAFPVGGALVLVGLLLLANPLLVQMLTELFAIRGPGVVNLGRLSLWLGLALILWPLIAPPPAAATTQIWGLPKRLRPGAQSVARGLLVFNAILGLQTLMDAAYLWGGASLPEGMTAAEYAHRGAYPLLATALLAGGFALVARPFAREDRRLRWLLLLWLGQNVALVLSALLRLELYVEAFGLTYLRLHSAIWMGLVAAGLGLTGWQVWQGRSNRWLLTRTAGLATATLYACCFVNFAAIIARENLSRETFDIYYICRLGPTAAAEIKATGRAMGTMGFDLDDTAQHCTARVPEINGWRDWGFREWRINRYLETATATEAADEDSGRG